MIGRKPRNENIKTILLYYLLLLSAIRTTFIGQTLIGTGFQWVDIIYYLLGTIAALALYQMLEKKPKYLEASRSAK